jgi:hypothetical protein
MIFGQLTLLMEMIPGTFGETRFIIEKDNKEIMRFPTTINRDLMVSLPLKSERRDELQHLIEFEIGEEYSLDIEGIVDIIMS